MFTLLLAPVTARAQQIMPGILVICCVDIAARNVGHNNPGMMGHRTPNIDRIAQEGVAFTDYDAQQSLTAGRAAFIDGQ